MKKNMIELDFNIQMLSELKLSQNDIEMLSYNIANMWKFFKNAYDKNDRTMILANLKKSVSMVNFLKDSNTGIKNHAMKTHVLKLALACFTANLFKSESPSTYEFKANKFLKDVMRLKRAGYKSIHNDRDYIKYTKALDTVLNAVGSTSDSDNVSIGWLTSISVNNLKEVSHMVEEHKNENTEKFTVSLSLYFNMILR